MPLYQLTKVLCDYDYGDGIRCDNPFTFPTLDTQEVLKRMELLGWSRNNGKYYCPTCTYRYTKEQYGD